MGILLLNRLALAAVLPLHPVYASPRGWCGAASHCWHPRARSPHGCPTTTVQPQEGLQGHKPAGLGHPTHPQDVDPVVVGAEIHAELYQELAHLQDRELLA